jgi:hypothetical protein
MPIIMHAQIVSNNEMTTATFNVPDMGGTGGSCRALYDTVDIVVLCILYFPRILERLMIYLSSLYSNTIYSTIISIQCHLRSE